MLRWNKADIPHKGWEYIGMEDLGEDAYPGDSIPYVTFYLKDLT